MEENELEKILKELKKLVSRLNITILITSQKYIDTLNDDAILEIKNLTKSRIEEILKNFDENFDTRTNERIKNKPIIMNIFQQFIDEIFESDKKYQDAFDVQQEILKELNLNEKQQELFEQWEDCQSRIIDDRVERAFVYAWAIADNIQHENKTEYEK